MRRRKARPASLLGKSVPSLHSSPAPFWRFRPEGTPQLRSGDRFLALSAIPASRALPIRDRHRAWKTKFWPPADGYPAVLDSAPGSLRILSAPHPICLAFPVLRRSSFALAPIVEPSVPALLLLSWKGLNTRAPQGKALQDRWEIAFPTAQEVLRTRDDHPLSLRNV